MIASSLPNIGRACRQMDLLLYGNRLYVWYIRTLFDLCDLQSTERVFLVFLIITFFLGIYVGAMLALKLKWRVGLSKIQLVVVDAGLCILGLTGFLYDDFLKFPWLDVQITTYLKMFFLYCAIGYNMIIFISPKFSRA